MRILIITFLLLCNTAFAQVNLNLGLKAYYPFTGNANDISGNNNNPVFNNATLTTDRFGNANAAYHFNGTNTYIKVPNNPTINMSNQMSIALWVKPMGWYTGTCYNNMMIMKGFNDNNPSGNYHVRFSDVFTGCTAPTTTQERFYATGVVAQLPIVQLNQWYSVVWTYDGTTSRLYVNCELKQSVNINLTFTNANDLFMGCMEDPSFPYWLNGDLDEIRIYNRALNADEVSVYGNCSTETINIGNVINDYTPILSLNPCENKITVENASAYNPGDTVVLIQMKGAVIDSTNTAAFGTVTDYKNAGNYEFNYVKSKTGNIIELRNSLLRQYDIPIGKVQLIRVPYYQNVNVTSTLTCLPWDGSKGGVLILNVEDTINLNADINVTGKGFTGGQIINPANNSFYCHENNYYYSNNPIQASPKGEAIATISDLRSYGKGALANGGGGGLEHNSGGGGGSNAGVGGKGGKEWITCGPPSDNGGLGGILLVYNNISNKIFLGGGGGAGHCDNIPSFNPNGGNGGGIVILRTNYIKANNRAIIADGGGGIECTRNAQAYRCHEGMGGGGGGGTILLKSNIYLDNLIISVKGGKGADMNGEIQGQLGPGGGGSGGIAWLSSATAPATVSVINNGGANGVNIDFGNDSYGATAGTAGFNAFNLTLPISTIPFKPNIDSVRFNNTATSCSTFNFDGLAYTNINPINSWQWYFGDGNTANTQNTSYTYPVTGTYPVKLVVTDINGCKDSISKNVVSSFLVMDAGPADTICIPNSTTLLATNNGGTIFSWTPALYLNNPALLNPIATPPSTTTFYLTTTNSQGCSQTDSVKINVRAANSFTISPPVAFCKNDSVQLNATGGDIYLWQPATALNNPSLANPVASPLMTTPYSVQITDTVCNNTTTMSTIVTVSPLPTIKAAKINDIDCSNPQSLLNANGGAQYLWSPAGTLNNASISSPVATPTITTKYIVKGTDLSGCVNYDSLIVNVTTVGNNGYLMPTGFTPNNDGKNDCYGIKYWGIVQEIDFSIYNRWGERVFYSTKVGDCWDGTYKGLQQPTAVFVYVIRARTNCQPTVFRKGTFALIR